MPDSILPLDAHRAAILTPLAAEAAVLAAPLDRVVGLVAAHLDVPLAWVGLAGAEAFTVLAGRGLPFDQIAFDGAPDAAALDSPAGLALEDLSADARFGAFAAAVPSVRAYAAVPLRVEGHAVAVLAVADTRPRAFDGRSRRALADFAALAAREVTALRLEHRLAEAERAVGDARQHLARTDAQYGTLVEQVRQVLFRTDAGGRWTFLNPAWTEATGLALEDSLGRHFLHFVHLDDRTHHREQFRRLLAGERRTTAHEVRYRRADGTYCWAEVHARAETDGTGRVVGISGTLVDVTDRKQIEQTLALAESRYRAIFDQAAVGIALCLPDGRVLSANPALERVLGRHGRALRNRALHVWADPDDAPHVRAAFQALHDGRETSCTVEARCLRRDGTPVETRLAVTLVPDEDGHPLFCVALVDDMTERKRTEAELIQAKEHAEQLARVKSSLLNNTSHEFRTPLAAILGFASLLTEEASDEAREFAMLIHESGQRLLTVLNAVLDLAHLESDEIHLDLVPLDLGDAVGSVVAGHAEAARAKGLELRWQRPEAAVSVVADRDAIGQIVGALVTNAVKFTDEGHVAVVLREADAGGAVEIVVEDTGIGIGEAFMPELFTAFKQESEGLDRSHEGSGLGLALARGWARQLGGDVRAESERGRGSVFTVCLPLGPSLPDGAAPPGEARR